MKSTLAKHIISVLFFTITNYATAQFNILVHNDNDTIVIPTSKVDSVSFDMTPEMQAQMKMYKTVKVLTCEKDDAHTKCDSTLVDSLQNEVTAMKERLNQVLQNYENIQKKLTELDNEVKNVQKGSVVKFAHFSVDDVQNCIADLNTNKDTYTSIFNNAFLNKLKNWHETYGIVVSLYCYSNLSNLPSKFANDWKNNKGWLKLAYHGRGSEYSTITAQKAKQYYDTFVTNLMANIGDIDCLDRIPRLDYFHCTKVGCLAMRDCDNGIYGFLGCDDWEYNKQTRATNYYLTDAQSVILDNNDMLYDIVNNIAFVKTDFRLEQVATRWESIDNCLAYYSNNNQRNMFEFFTHENYLTSSSYDGMMVTILEWLKDKNYIWDFPMNNLFLTK